MKYVTVANMNVNIVEHKGQRVLTTEQVADVYGCESRNISDNFKNNELHFEEGKHYFKLEGAELKAFKRHSENIGLPINKFASTLYLWTRRGASRHCKMLGTEKAWEMFDCLEENYFSQQKPELPDFTDPVIAARAWADEVEKKQLAEAKVAELQPKADFYDAAASSESLFSMADVAKVLDMGIGRNKLFKFLRDKKILQGDNMPYQRFVDAGYFKVVEGKFMAGDNVVISKTTYVKQKGIDYIRKCLKNEAVD